MTRRLRSAAFAVAGIAGSLLPSAAHACAACGLGLNDRARVAFLISTGFLSLLPLALIIGGLMLLRRHARLVMADEFIDRDEVAPAAEPGPEPARSGPAVLEGAPQAG